jgi:pantothenate kinase
MITNMTDLNEYDKMSDKAQGGDMADQDFVIGSDAQVA